MRQETKPFLKERECSRDWLMSYVKEKIKASKNRGPVTRARARRREIITLAETLIDMLEPYRKEAIQVWIDGMRATKPIYEKGIRVGEEPDWKERRENAAL